MKIPSLPPRTLLALAGAALLALSAGCAQTNFARVRPWERAQLADYTMDPNRDTLAVVAAEHIYFSREAASGGRGVGGSGCGCN